MDTASIMSIFGSVDAGSLIPPLTGIPPILEGIFNAISGAINVAVLGSAGVAGSIQSVLGSIAGQ
ncbi:hypothetical protein B2J88_29500 [Rhodococcus sp. SRB_17]|nr:hypothetical protein [Rhodococcus sp. SRB_17]